LVWGETVSCGIVEGYPKNAKNAVFDLALPTYKIPNFFTIASVLTSTLTVYHQNRGDPSSLYRTYGALQVLQENKSFWFGLIAV